MLSPNLFVTDQEESIAERTAVLEEIIQFGDATDDVIKVLKMQEYYLNTLMGIKDPVQRNAICDAKDAFDTQYADLVEDANRLRREAHARLLVKTQSNRIESIQQRSWMRLSPETRDCLAGLAMSGRSGMTDMMQRFIDKRHLAEALDEVDNVNELNRQ